MKKQPSSYVRRLMIQARSRDGSLFYIHPNVGVFAKLDGYAVIPIEEYEKLLLFNRQQQEKPDCYPVE
jgi:hypothetical protein